MEILITNDDGWGAKGILTLTRLMEQFGHVTVIAPDGARSGQSNAISVQKPMYLQLLEQTEKRTVYTTNGTPSDCIKIAINIVYKGAKPDLVVSGINHGSNGAINVIYSGTMGACFVACEQSIPAIGYSIYDHDPDADFSYFEPYIIQLTKKILEVGTPDGICWNINAPIGPLKGAKITRQCRGHWEKEMEPHVDENGTPYYILVGNFVNHEPDAEDTDEWAAAHGYVSVCPSTIDMTAKNLDSFQNLGFENL